MIETLQRLYLAKGKEINREVAKILEQNLQEYYKYNNNKLSDTIIVEIVGNSQIYKLYQEEVETIKEITQYKYNLKLPQFPFILLNKRIINDRFFSDQLK
ncbi:unnamed protein product [Paramecium sonneborni]|uniref:Piwi domain-containing protein n=1 Tax=Paramecium sonneborni TaxID=65129 RepID=A0A8S1RRE9_9CILI|nr:unnamed protein product [Paramecium sonneborni]